MSYRSDYLELKSVLGTETEEKISLSDTDVRFFSFSSPFAGMLPGESAYRCNQHGFQTEQVSSFSNSPGVISEVLDVHDSQVQENISFTCPVFLPKGCIKADKFVLLLHGFNEKTWFKYYPWARRIARDTGKAVLLFPLAFHMNRAPHTWSEARDMFAASRQRKEEFPDMLHSSLSNVAISTRLHAKPQRFVWSGLQAYNDIIFLMEEIRGGRHPVISKDASADIFAYSIGAFLAEILMMADHKGFFSRSRLLMFCGGPVFNRISPVSKFILDSEANVHLYSFLVEHLESHLAGDERLRHYLGPDHPEGMYFRSMLSYSGLSAFRETRLRAMADRLYAIALEGDTVIYPYEVLNTLRGRYHDIPVRADILQLPYPFRHEMPFPWEKAPEERVTASFDRVFGLVTEWFA